MKRALDDIRVVELAEGLAGSYSGKLFADLGAHVVKVERPEGNALRHYVSARAADGTPISGTFLHLNTNKRSLVLGGADVAGDRRRLEQLLATSDLVIAEANRGALSEWGLDWESLHAAHPQLTVAHVSGFGATGPYADYQWDDIVAQAMSGALLLHNDPDQDPLKLPGYLGFYIVGHTAALGALAAVSVARSSGVGRFVDCAAIESFSTMPPRATTLLAHFYRDRQPNPNPVTHRTTLIPTGVFPCADGHVALMSTPQQLNEMLGVLDSDELRAQFALPDVYERTDTKEVIDSALYPWLFSHTRAEATALAQAAGWPFAGVNTPQEVLDADHLHQRGFWTHTDDPVAGAVDLPGAWCKFGEGGWSLRRLAPALGEYNAEFDRELETAAATAAAAVPVAVAVADTSVRVTSEAPPLTGVRVVDLTTVWAGPYAAMLLADLGAEVIRVENPFVLPPTTKGYTPRPVISDLGFLSSGYGPPLPDRRDRPWNRHSMNNCICRNKLSVAMDTRQAEGRELLLRLVEKSDVFLENFKLSGLARIGIHVSELMARNPRLVVVRMPPAGATGDWSDYTGFGAQFDGLSGLAYVCGHLDADPVTTPATTYMDCASGPAAAFAAMIALRYREATGRGQLVELSQSENVINHLGDLYVDCQLGRMPQRLGNRDRWRAPQGLYRSKDGKWLAVSVRNDDEWRSLAKTIGRPELADDDRFATNAARTQHHGDCDAILSEWTGAHAQYDAFHTLQSAGIAAGPMLDEPSFENDPHVQARQWLQPLLSLDVGTHLHPGYPYRGVPSVWRRGSPVMGQDNAYVYKEILGVSDADFERYRAQHILADDYLDKDGSPY